MFIIIDIFINIVIRLYNYLIAFFSFSVSVYLVLICLLISYLLFPLFCCVFVQLFVVPLRIYMNYLPSCVMISLN